MIIRNLFCCSKTEKEIKPKIEAKDKKVNKERKESIEIEDEDTVELTEGILLFINKLV